MVFGSLTKASPPMGRLQTKVKAQEKREIEEAGVRKFHMMPSGKGSAEEVSQGFWSIPDRDNIGGGGGGVTEAAYYHSCTVPFPRYTRNSIT